MSARARNDQHMPPTPAPALDIPKTRLRFFKNHGTIARKNLELSQGGIWYNYSRYLWFPG